MPARRRGWLLGAALTVLAAVIVVIWAGTRPGYDPYGWLVWGHLTIHGALDTNGAPSWKPLPFLFTVPYAVLGRSALWLWMTTAVAVSLAGFAFAARLAYRLTDPPAGRRWIGYLAAALALLFLAGTDGYAHSLLSGQSDTMIVSLCLAAIDCHLGGRRRCAFALLLLAGLGRPEAWPAVGLYVLWGWRTTPQNRRLLIGGLALLALLWFGIPALSSKSPFTAGNIAMSSPNALHGNVLAGELDRFFDLYAAQVYVCAALALAFAVLRRHRPTLLIAGLALLWVVVELAFVLHGWPGVPRYLFEPGAVTAVLAGAGLGRLLLELPVLGRRWLLARPPPGRRRWRLPRGLAGAATAAGAALAVLLPVGVLASLAPAGAAKVRVERADLARQRQRARMIDRLPGLIARLGGRARLFACGQPTTTIGYQSVLAWDLGVNTGVLYWTPHDSSIHPRPVVLFKPAARGWKVETIDVPRGRVACRGLNVAASG